MKKRLLAGGLAGAAIFLFLVTVSLAEKPALEDTSLSLAEAQELALKDNNQLQLAQFTLDEAQLSLDRADFSSDKMQDLEDKIGQDQNTYYAGYVVPLLSETGYQISKIALDYTENNILYQVEAAYYGIQQADKMVAAAEASYERAQEQMKNSQLRFEQGMVAQMDVITAEAQLKSAEADLNSAQNEKDKAIMQLNLLLDLDLDTPLTLTDEMKYEKMAEINVEETIQEAMDTDVTYVTAREGYNGAKITMDYQERYFPEHVFSHREAKAAYLKAEVDRYSAEENLKLRIKTSYLDLVTAEENYQVLQKSLEQAQEAYRLTKLRYEVGMATQYEVLNSEEMLLQAETGVLSALYQHNMAKAKFVYGIY